MDLENETVAVGATSKVWHFSFEFRFRGDCLLTINNRHTLYLI